MKNLKLAFSIIVMALFIIVACEDEKTNPVAQNGSATISGIAYVNLSELNDTNVLLDQDYEFVPTGTILYATFSSQELVLVPNGGTTYADIIVTTAVGADGAYNFEIPANSKVFSVDITSNDFSANYTEVGADTITYPDVFTLGTVTVNNIHTGAVRIENLYFN
jgi:hypothetical protein